MASFPIDLRSDMLGLRPRAVIEAMAAAAVVAASMDEDDSRKRALEEAAGDLLGFDDALFLPTCTMANQIAVRYLSEAGAPIIAETTTHLVLREAGAATRLHGANLTTFEAVGGHPAPKQVEIAMQGIGSKANRDIRCGLWVEETHNAAGGTLVPEGWIDQYAALCRSQDAWMHMDGARIWNAAAASGRPLRDHLTGVDSLAVSLNKCLDAPVGGLLLGSRAFIDRARSIRTDLGGQWRPVGALAAAGLVALADFRDRLGAIHRRARNFHAMLANDVSSIAGQPPQTNIVMLMLGDDERANRFLDRLGLMGVGAMAYGSGRIRFVLHSGISDGQIEAAAAAVKAIAAAGH